jgi:hypothetical protein
VLSLRLSGLVAGCALALVLTAAAIAVALGTGPALRAWFRFDFAHPRTLSEFCAIVVNNARVAALPLVGAASLPTIGRGRFLFDVAITLLAAGNSVLVGLALGAYGVPLATELFPHAALELGGFAVAVAAYLDARAGAKRRARLADGGICALGLLIAGAAIEVWVE